MTALSDREHARLARELIEACGGLDEASRATGLSKGQLSRCQQAHYRETLSARTINCLEAYSDRAIYSAAMADAVGVVRAVGELREHACDLTEAASLALGSVRKALSDDGKISPREADAIARAEVEVERALENLRAARRATEAASST